MDTELSAPPAPSPVPTAGNTPKPPAPTPAPASPAPAAPASELAKLLDEATSLIKQKRYGDAEAVCAKCIKTDSKAAKCYLLMGITQAGLSHKDEGARNYRLFLKYAPDSDSNVPKVKKMLEEYESKTHPGGG